MSNSVQIILKVGIAQSDLLEDLANNGCAQRLQKVYDQHA